MPDVEQNDRDALGVLNVDHYEYPPHVLIQEARKYAERRPPMAQSDYFIQELSNAAERMWNVMQRACNHPERWNQILTDELDSWRPPSHIAHDQGERS